MQFYSFLPCTTISICQGCYGKVKQTFLDQCCSLAESTREKRGHRVLSYCRISVFHFRPIQQRIKENTFIPGAVLNKSYSRCTVLCCLSKVECVWLLLQCLCSLHCIYRIEHSINAFKRPQHQHGQTEWQLQEYADKSGFYLWWSWRLPFACLPLDFRQSWKLYLSHQVS